jgi:hypothetical protein
LTTSPRDPSLLTSSLRMTSMKVTHDLELSAMSYQPSAKHAAHGSKKLRADG